MDVPSLVEVAVGIIVRPDGRVLIARRRADAASYPDCWEFPGGKVAAGESPAEAVWRELSEELAVDATATAALPPVAGTLPDGRPVRLHPFVCAIVAGVPRPLAAAELRWEWPADLRRFRFPPTNDSLVKSVFDHLVADAGVDSTPAGR